MTTTSRPSTQMHEDSPTAKKPRIMSYRDRWDVLDNEWNEFHQLWWGKNWEETQNMQPGVIVGEYICDHLGILRGSEGVLYERTEYRAFTNRLRAAKMTQSHHELWGCLLLGQPGIGKSVFLLFFLLQCMANEETALFTNSKGETFLIDKEGVRQMGATLFDPSKDLPSNTRVWSLVDSPRAKVPPPPSVTDDRPVQMFSVLAVSPDESRYKELIKGRIHRWWMSAWEDRELHALLNRLFILSKKKTQFETLSAVQSLMAEFGPCPRDIICALLDPSGFDDNVNKALSKPATAQSVIDLIRDPYKSDGISHHIILVQRLGPILETKFESDKYHIQLKTEAIKKGILEKYRALKLNEAQQLFCACAGIGPKGAVFTGNLFEGLAIRYTTGEQFSVGGVFAQMKRVPSSREKFPIRFIYQAPGHKWTIVADADRGLVLKGSPLQSPELPFSSNSAKMPWLFRKCVDYKGNDDDTFSIDSLSYYCPTALNHPLFDAFFFEILSDLKAILWVLQMTIQHNHNDAKKGFESIKSIVKKAKEKGSWQDIDIKYVLVVPHKKPGLDVEWNFSGEFDGCQGDVFIQQLDIDVLGCGGVGFGVGSFSLEVMLGGVVQ